MSRSESVNELATALAKAQGEMKTPDKNKTAKIPTKTGGSYQYSYADLSEVIECIRKPLAANGLSHVFTMERGAIQLRLMHTSGQWISSDLDLPSNQDIKMFGGTITYLRRYMLCAMLDIHADEDTDSAPEDGATYTERRPAPAKTPRPTTTAPVAVKPVNAFQEAAKSVIGKEKLEELNKLIASSGKWSTTQVSDFMLKHFNKTRLGEFTEPEYALLVNAILHVDPSERKPEPGDFDYNESA